MTNSEICQAKLADLDNLIARLRVGRRPVSFYSMISFLEKRIRDDLRQADASSVRSVYLLMMSERVASARYEATHTPINDTAELQAEYQKLFGEK